MGGWAYRNHLSRWWFQIFFFIPILGEDSHFDYFLFHMGWNHQLVTGSTTSTLLHDRINPKDCQVLSLGDTGFLQFFRVVSRDYGKPRVMNIMFTWGVVPKIDSNTNRPSLSCLFWTVPCAHCFVSIERKHGTLVLWRIPVPSHGVKLGSGGLMCGLASCIWMIPRWLVISDPKSGIPFLP